jgi:hypothetical protein
LRGFDIARRVRHTRVISSGGQNGSRSEDTSGQKGDPLENRF